MAFSFLRDLLFEEADAAPAAATMGSVVMPQDQPGDAAPSLQLENNPTFWGPSAAPTQDMAAAPTPPAPAPEAPVVMDVAKPAVASNEPIVLNFSGSDMPAVVPEEEEAPAHDLTNEQIVATMEEKETPVAELMDDVLPPAVAPAPVPVAEPIAPSQTWTVPEKKAAEGVSVDRISALESEAASRISSIHGTIEQHETTIADLKNTISSLRSEISKLEELQAQLGKDRAALEMLERNKQDVARQEEELKASLASVEEQVSE